MGGSAVVGLQGQNVGRDSRRTRADYTAGGRRLERGENLSRGFWSGPLGCEGAVGSIRWNPVGGDSLWNQPAEIERKRSFSLSKHDSRARPERPADQRLRRGPGRQDRKSTR